MSDRQAQRHAAAMLAHNIGSGVDALDDLPHEYAIENFDSLSETFLKLGRSLLRISEIQIAKNEQLRSHQ